MTPGMPRSTYILLIVNLVLPLRKKADALEKARRFIARSKKS